MSASSRIRDRGGHVAPRGVGACSPSDRPVLTSRRPGAARRASTAAYLAPKETPRPPRPAASLAPGSRPPAHRRPAALGALRRGRTLLDHTYHARLLQRWAV